jgi:uncharacterized protein YeaO (DUF488 family)
MKIYTTYFAKLKKLPDDIAIVPISNSVPGSDRQGTSHSNLENMKYKRLVPPWYVVKTYKDNGDKDQYTESYQKLILSQLDPHKVVEDFKRMVGYRDVALVCYEKSSDFCHRHIVAQWLRDAGYDVSEWVES